MQWLSTKTNRYVANDSRRQNGLLPTNPYPLLAMKTDARCSSEMYDFHLNRHAESILTSIVVLRASATSEFATEIFRIESAYSIFLYPSYLRRVQIISDKNIKFCYN